MTEQRTYRVKAISVTQSPYHLPVRSPVVTFEGFSRDIEESLFCCDDAQVNSQVEEKRLTINLSGCRLTIDANSERVYAEAQTGEDLTRGLAFLTSASPICRLWRTR